MTSKGMVASLSDNLKSSCCIKKMCEKYVFIMMYTHICHSNICIYEIKQSIYKWNTNSNFQLLTQGNKKKGASHFIEDTPSTLLAVMFLLKFPVRGGKTVFLEANNFCSHLTCL